MEAKALSAQIKTEICHFILERGQCPSGELCMFAHSVHELRTIQRLPSYKSKPCRNFWNQGSCPFGKRCTFVHHNADPEAVWNSVFAGNYLKPSEELNGEMLQLQGAIHKTLDSLRPPTFSSGYAGSVKSSGPSSPSSYTTTRCPKSPCSDVSDLGAESVILSSEGAADDEEVSHVRLPVFRELSRRGHWVAPS